MCVWSDLAASQGCIVCEHLVWEDFESSRHARGQDHGMYFSEVPRACNVSAFFPFSPFRLCFPFPWTTSFPPKLSWKASARRRGCEGVLKSCHHKRFNTRGGRSAVRKYRRKINKKNDNNNKKRKMYGPSLTPFFHPEVISSFQKSPKQKSKKIRRSVCSFSI